MPLSLEDQERIAQTAYLKHVVDLIHSSDRALRAIAQTLGRVEKLLFLIADIAVAFRQELRLVARGRGTMSGMDRARSAEQGMSRRRLKPIASSGRTMTERS